MADDTTPPTTSSSLPPGFEHRLYEAIKVQRPAVIAHIQAVRRANPDATPAEAIKIMESRYLAAVTTASAGVGGAAAVPGIGTAVALGLNVADLALFFELSALYALSVAEVHGLHVEDPERAKVIVLGMTLGEDSQGRVTQLVSGAVAGGARTASTMGVVGDVARAGAAASTGAWGDVVATAVPDGQLNPLMKQMLTTAAVKLGAKAGTGTVAKILPFGIGMVVGGAASFFFGKSVVLASRSAFSSVPTEWPADLDLPDLDGDGIPDPPRALIAMRAAADDAKGFGEDVWGKVSSGATTAGAVVGTGVSAAAATVSRPFRRVDIDGDGIADDPQALTAAKQVGGAVAGAAGALGGKVSGLIRRRSRSDVADPAVEGQPGSTEDATQE
ncbi:hypothetical protein [Agrococcus terreus]